MQTLPLVVRQKGREGRPTAGYKGRQAGRKNGRHGGVVVVVARREGVCGVVGVVVKVWWEGVCGGGKRGSVCGVGNDTVEARVFFFAFLFTASR